MDAGTGTKTSHILLLEDDRAHQDLILRVFRDNPEQFRLTFAGTLGVARQVLERDPPDLIIADWILPDGKGLDILPRRDGIVTIPLVIMTSHGDEHLAVNIMKSGAIDYVVKSATVFKDLPHIARRALRDWENILRRRHADEMVQESQKRLADIIGFLPDAVMAIDNEGRVIAWNDAIERMTGVMAADMLGKGDHEYSIPFYGERRPILIDLVLMKDPEVEKKYIFIQRDGERITSETVIPSLFEGKGAYLWATASPLYDVHENCIGAIEVIRDISARKQNEDLQRQREITLKTLLNAPADTIALLDRKGTIIDINEAGASSFGGTVKSIIGQCAYDLLPPNVAKVPKTIDPVFETGKPVILEDERSGRCFHNRIFPIFNSESSSVDRIAIFSQDITEQKHAEVALNRSERNLFRAEKIGHLGNWDWDIVANILIWSEEIYHIFGVSHDFILSFENIESLIHPDDQESNRRLVQEFLAKGSEIEYEFRIIRPDGRERFIYQKAEIQRDAEGCPLTAFGIMQDITDRKRAEDALRESEEKYRNLYQHSAIGIFHSTLQGRFIDLNPALSKMLGYNSPEEVVTSIASIPEQVYAESPQYDEITTAILEGGGFAKVENHYIRKDGTHWYGTLHVRMVPDREGKPCYYEGFVEDITDRKMAEKELRESEEKYRHLVENVNDVIWQTTSDLRFTYLSPAVQKITGYSIDELMGKSLFSIITEQSVIEVKKRLSDRKKEFDLGDKDITTVFEIEAMRNGGGRVWMEVSSTLVVGPDGAPIGFQGISRDITERKLAEMALIESETRFRALIQNSSDLIRIIDKKDRIAYESSSAERILGYPSGYMTGRDPMAYIHPDDIARVKHDFQEVLDRKNTGAPTEFRIRKADGEYIWVDSIGTNLLDVPGVNGIVVTTRPIQQRKEAEEEIRKTISQLERSEALLRKVYDILPIGLWLADKNGTLQYGNPAGVKIWGAEPLVPIEQYGVFKARRFPSGEEIEPDDWALAHTLHEGVTIKDEMLEIDAFDGKKKIILNYTAPLNDSAGLIDGAIVVNQEITEKVKAEQALRENEARLATAMDIAGLVNWEFDVATGMFTFDDRFYSLYGTTAEREGGNLIPADTYLQEFVYPDDRPAVLASIRKILTTTDPDYFGKMEHRITPRDGSVRTIVARFAPIMGPDGKVIRTFGANQDITDFKLMESEIRSLNTVLEQRVKDRTKDLEEEIAQRLTAEEKLQKSYDEKVLLLKEVHHRVKNNLQIIASLLNLQSRYITDESTLAAIRESQNRVKAMALVHEKLYRNEDLSHVSLRDYIIFLSNGLFESYDAKRQGIRFMLDVHDVNVDIDTAIPLGLILNELISNSLKYAFPNGRKGEISVSVIKEDHTLTVHYCDNGIGIPADLDWRNTQSLGLRLVNTLVDQMNGTVELEQNAGTRFTIVLHEKEPRNPT